MAYSLRKFLLLDWSIFRAEREAMAQRKSERIASAPLEKPDCLDEKTMADLGEKLKHQDWRPRLAATRFLAKARVPCSTLTLVRLLHDENLSVRWAAADGLKYLHREAVRPLMEELTREFHSTSLRQASHHVLHDLYMNGNLNHWEIEVYRSLERRAPDLQVALSANLALLADVGRR